MSKQEISSFLGENKSKLGVLSNEETNKLMHSSVEKGRQIGPGLSNLGNTCFLNSTLQCLIHTRSLHVYLRSKQHQKQCQVKGGEYCSLCEFERLVASCFGGSARSIAPRDIVSNLRRISTKFRIGRQEDANEFLILLLEKFRKNLIPDSLVPNSPDLKKTLEKLNVLNQIFAGTLRSQVHCLSCNYKSNTYDPYNILSLVRTPKLNPSGINES